MPTITRLKDKHVKLVEPYQHKDDSQKYYNTKLWRNLREDYKRHFPLCEVCLSEGRITPAEEVHHHIPFMRGKNEDERWNLLLDRSNLLSVCRECHLAIHRGEKTINI